MGKMNRRGFFAGLLGTVIGAYSVGKFTYGVEKEHPQKFLTRKWNEWSKGLGASGHPKYVLVSQELFDDFERSCKSLQRYCPTGSSLNPKILQLGRMNERVLVFKTSIMRPESHLKGYEVIFI